MEVVTDKLQERLVVPGGERAVWAEPEQGTGLAWESGSVQEWSLANLWILERRSALVILSSWLSPSRGQAEPTITNQK